MDRCGCCVGARRDRGSECRCEVEGPDGRKQLQSHSDRRLESKSSSGTGKRGRRRIGMSDDDHALPLCLRSTASSQTISIPAPAPPEITFEFAQSASNSNSNSGARAHAYASSDRSIGHGRSKRYNDQTTFCIYADAYATRSPQRWQEMKAASRMMRAEQRDEVKVGKTRRIRGGRRHHIKKRSGEGLRGWVFVRHS